MKKIRLIGVLLLTSLLIYGCEQMKESEISTSGDKVVNELKEVIVEEKVLAPKNQELSFNSMVNQPAYVLEKMWSEEDRKLIAKKLFQLEDGTDWKASWGSMADERFSLYKSGKVNEGKYKGRSLYLLSVGCDGPCFKNDLYRILADEDFKVVTLLEKYSTKIADEGEYEHYFKGVFKDIDSETEFAQLNSQESLVDKKGVKFLLIDKDSMLDTEVERKEVGSLIFENEFGKLHYKVYDNNSEDKNKVKPGQLLLVKKDGSIDTYIVDLGIKNQGSKTVTLNNGNVIDLDQYFFDAGACAIDPDFYNVNMNVDEKDLTIIGKTSNGTELYTIKNPKIIKEGEDGPAVLKDLESFFSAFNGSASGEGKKTVTLEQFMSKNGLIYFKDKLGRFGLLVNKEFRPPAECGKPVIYLYPQKEIKVNVQVEVSAFSVTEPDYGERGWDVIAKPNGELKNLADGKVYPYLFWEGESYDGVNLSGGFVIEKEKSDEFLRDALAKLGLNEIESRDFRDFWVPKMKNIKKPYLFVSFIGTQDFNKVAPLKITPKPDTLIRVFMYFSPIEEKIKVKEQILKSKQRKGFTVVEWGGTSSVDWKEL